MGHRAPNAPRVERVSRDALRHPKPHTWDKISQGGNTHQSGQDCRQLDGTGRGHGFPPACAMRECCIRWHVRQGVQLDSRHESP